MPLTTGVKRLIPCIKLKETHTQDLCENNYYVKHAKINGKFNVTPNH